MQRYEQGLLPRSMQLWLQQLLEIEIETEPGFEFEIGIDQALNRSLRPHHERPRR